jgi:IS5 family transposase
MPSLVRGKHLRIHIVVDTDLGLVHTVVGTASNVNDVMQAHSLVRGEETDLFADVGDQGAGKRQGSQDIKVHWRMAMRPSEDKVQDKSTPMGAIMDNLEQAKARIWANLDLPFRLIKRQFGHVKVHYRGPAENTARLTMPLLWAIYG